MNKIHLGKILVDKHLITEEQLNKAIAEQHSTGEKLGNILINSGLIKESDLLKFLSEQLKVPLIDLKNYSLDPEVVNILPEFYARRFRAIVIRNDENGLLVGMVDPLDLVATDELKRILKRPFSIAVVREEELLDAIDMMYRRTSEISSLAEELQAELTYNEFDISQLAAKVTSADAPVVKLLQTLFEDAAQIDASDIHIEPGEQVLRIRQRVDGVLHEQILKEKQVAGALALRLKLMAGLNIAEKRLPQDGRFSIKLSDKNFDVRLSTLPTQWGESVVMRLLNQSADILKLEQLGMPPIILEKFKHLLMTPNGLILITGPTGSGKTTTLYAALSLLNSSEKKILTVEDPVEYRLPRINQVQVQPKIDLTFARVLRAMLRQDPDIIMVGEMRDSETVSIALRAALTGHLVLATLHTNDAKSSALRLIDMGAEGYLVAAVLRAIVSQRLVRRICERCKKSYSLSSQEQIWMESVNPEVTQKTFYKGSGCNYCHNTGYKGQIGVYELLVMNRKLADALRKNDTGAFDAIVKEDPDFKSLILYGLDLALEGITTISEVMRVAGEGEIEMTSS